MKRCSVSVIIRKRKSELQRYTTSCPLGRRYQEERAGRKQHVGDASEPPGPIALLVYNDETSVEKNYN